MADEIGRTVNLPDNPVRIIALTPSLTEILFALGLGSKVVGATTWADYPPEARGLPRVGAYISPNLEQVVALAPDMVLVNREGNPPWVLDKLEEAGIPVYVHWPGDPTELPKSLARISEACGVPERGRVLAGEMKAHFKTIMARLKGVRLVSTLMAIGSRPLVSVSPESFHGRLLTMVRARNVADGAGGRWPRLSLEYVLEAQPEVVVVSTMERGQNLERELKFWRELPG
ncbi:MAG: helical backbone metal receptor, partial [Thermodesulfobacteriota bacterium]|nr:helical backbone metal receptor [Thermodesulfobacteriota bacterium]